MPSFKIIGLLVRTKNVLKGFTIYGHGSHLSHVTWTSYINFRSPFPRRLHIKLGFAWQSGFRGDDFGKWWTTDDVRRSEAGSMGILQAHLVSLTAPVS